MEHTNFVTHGLPGKANSHSAEQKIPIYSRNWLNTILIKQSNFTILWASTHQFQISRPISTRSISIFPSHLFLCFTDGLYPWSFPIKIVYPLLISPCKLHVSCYVPWPYHHRNVRWTVEIMKLHIKQHSAASSCFLSVQSKCCLQRPDLQHF